MPLRTFLRVFLLLGIASLARPDDRPDALLRLDVDARGSSSLYFVLYERSPAPGLQQAVAAALGCSLRDAWHDSVAGDWTLVAGCDGLFRRTGWLVEGHLDLVPLAALIERLDSKSLQARVVLRTPGAVRGDFAGWKKTSPRRSDVAFEYRCLPGTRPPPLRLEFGYTSRDLLPLGAALSSIFLLPALLTLALRRRVLRVQSADPSQALFSFQFSSGWVVTAAYFFWMFGAEALHVRALADLAADGNNLIAALLGIVFYGLPPMLAHALCAAVCYPVFAGIRGAEWRRRDAVRQALAGDAAFLIPILLFLAGLEALSEPGPGLRSAGAWWVAALAASAILALWKARVDHMTFQSITEGELRNRVFALAEKAGVKLEQLYLLPSGKGNLPNAFAARGGLVLLSQDLVEQLSKREVDAVVGHELAHLKSGHTRWFSLPVIVILTVVMGTVWYQMAGRFSTLATYLPVGSLAAFVALFFVSRRFERSADANAIALTGDPEALITGLTKLARLNLTPLHWSRWQEQLLTHPSLLRRSQAIARAGGIPPERLQLILNAPVADAERYSLPSSIHGTLNVFSSSYKNQFGGLYGLAMLVISVGIPLGVAYLLATGRLGPLAAGLLGVAGVFLTLVVAELLRASTGLLSYRGLARNLKARLSAEGIDAPASNGVFVGFAPDAHPRVYENHDNWDVGFVLFAGDRLCYVGDHVRFGLQAEHITDVRLGPGWPAWWPSQRVYVTWHDPRTGAGGTFNLNPSDVRFEWQQASAARQLRQEIEAWRALPAGAPAAPAPLAVLETPRLGAVTSSSLAGVGGFRNIQGLLLQVLVLAYLFTGTLDSHSWYVYAVSLAAVLFRQAPFLFYRDPSAPRAGTPAARPAAAGSWIFGGAGAVALGWLAAAAGAALYYGAFRLTGYRISLLALPVGLLVGKAVRLGSRGRSDRSFRVLAAYLTFVAMAVPDTVRLTHDLAGLLVRANAGGRFEPEPTPADLKQSQEYVGAIQSMPVSERLALLWPSLVVLPLAFSVLMLPYAYLYPLAALAVGIGMWLAWRQNKSPG